MIPEGITRRQALALYGTAAGSIAGCNTSDVQSERTTTAPVTERAEPPPVTEQTAPPLATERDTIPPEVPLIDARVHLVPIPAFGRDAFSADAAVAWMDDHGVDQVVLQPLESPTSWSFPIPSWWILREAAKYPDRFILFGTASPLMIEQFGQDRLIHRLNTYVEMRAKGVDELKAALAVDDQWMQVVYETCANLGVPLLIHIDDTNASDSIGLPNFEEMLTAYPETEFIAHGPGWWSQISRDPKQFGGYPKGPMEPGGPIPRLLSDYDNIYADISAGSGWNALLRDHEFTQSFLIIPAVRRLQIPGSGRRVSASGVSGRLVRVL